MYSYEPDSDPDRGWPGVVRSVGGALGYVVVALSVAGFLTLASASTVRGTTLSGDFFFFVKRQIVWLGVGGLLAYVVSRWDYHWWKVIACPLGILTVALLILVLIVGPKINGSRRWLQFGPISFQPSELAKLSTLLMFAFWYSRVPLRVGRLMEGLAIPSAGLGIVLVLVLLEPDFGATALTATVIWVMLFLGGANKRWLAWGAIAGVFLLFLYVRFNPHRWELILAWWEPERHPTLAYQYLEARKAYTLGGMRGVGFLNSIQKRFYLPEVHTDFIFPILGEEMGLVGTLSVILLFAGFFVCGSSISLLSNDRFGRLLGMGITILITLQAAFNVCVVTGLLPTKGLALPFFSYGGSNLTMTLLECGILLSVRRHSHADD